MTSSSIQNLHNEKSDIVSASFVPRGEEGKGPDRLFFAAADCHVSRRGRRGRKNAERERERGKRQGKESAEKNCEGRETHALLRRKMGLDNRGDKAEVVI